MPALVVCTKADKGLVEQQYAVQPPQFCEDHKLSPPHAFTASKENGPELFVKLATMSAFPSVLLLHY